MSHESGDLSTPAKVNPSSDEVRSDGLNGDIYFCHVWKDRSLPVIRLHQELRKSRYEILMGDADLEFGRMLLKEVDSFLDGCRVGVVVVTPGFLRRLDACPFSDDAEIGEIFGKTPIVGVLHQVALGDVVRISPALASFCSYDTAVDTAEVIAERIIELVRLRS